MAAGFAFMEIMPKTNGRLFRADLPSFRSCQFNHLLHAYIYTLAKYKTAHSSAKLHKISDIHKYILYISVKKVIFAEYSTKYTLSVNFYTFPWLKLKDRLFWALFPQMQILSSVIANHYTKMIFEILICLYKEKNENFSCDLLAYVRFFL